MSENEMRPCPNRQKSSPNALNLTEGSTVVKVKKKKCSSVAHTMYLDLCPNGVEIT